MAYKLLRSIYLNDQLQEAGAEIDIADKELVEKLLAKGTIEAVGGSSNTTPLVNTPAASELEQQPSAPSEAAPANEAPAPKSKQTQPPTPEEIEQTIQDVEAGSVTSIEIS